MVVLILAINTLYNAGEIGKVPLTYNISVAMVTEDTDRAQLIDLGE